MLLHVNKSCPLQTFCAFTKNRILVIMFIILSHLNSSRRFFQHFSTNSLFQLQLFYNLVFRIWTVLAAWAVNSERFDSIHCKKMPTSSAIDTRLWQHWTLDVNVTLLTFHWMLEYSGQNVNNHRVFFNVHEESWNNWICWIVEN